jgi:AraC-like DNA-binding protein
MPGERLARTRQRVAPLRHTDGALPAEALRTFALDIGPSTFVPPQPAGWSQLVMLRAGSALLQCEGVRTSLSREIACWLPGNATYALDLRTRCEVRIVYVAAAVYSVAFGPVETSPLLFELVERAVRCGYLDPAVARDARLQAVINDELANLRAATSVHSLALPRSPKLLAAIEAQASSPESPNIGALAAAAGMSLRTFERRFIRETELTPRAWLRRARLHAALVALQSGASVTEAGFACGYASLSAFVAAYRAVFGVTPGRVARSG